jgi:hypothetical protein
MTVTGFDLSRAVIAAGFPQVGIGLLGVSLAFGLTVVKWPMRSAMCPAAISTPQ